MRIDLGLESRVTTSNMEIDPVAAAMDLQVAQESLLVASMEHSVLATACENLERGIAFASAVADKTGDAGTATAVGMESLKSSLAIIGQEAVASQVTVGAEDVTGGLEAASGMLGKMIEKSKEIAAKIWKFVKDLVGKVINFFKGLVGKGMTNYDELVKLTKDLKDSKRTMLEADKFSESVYNSLGGKMRVLVLQNKGSIDGAAVAAYINSMKSSFETAMDSNASDNWIDVITGGDFDNLVSTFANAVVDADIVKAKDTLEGVLDYIIDNVEVGSNFKDSAQLKDLPSEIVTALVEKADEISDKVAGGKFGNVTLTLNGASGTILYITDDGKTGRDEFKKATEANSIKSNFKKALNGIKIESVHVTVDEADTKDMYENIKPIEFGEIESVRDALKDANKVALKVSENYGKKIDKAEKDLNKTIKTVIKDIKPGSPVEDILKLALNKLVSISTKAAKDGASNLVASSKEVVKSGVIDICKESAKLYTKEK